MKRVFWKSGLCALAALVLSATTAFGATQVVLQEDFTSSDNNSLPTSLSAEWDAGLDVIVVDLATANVPADHTSGDGYVLRIGDLGSGGYNFAFPSSPTDQSANAVEAWSYFAFDGITGERDYGIFINSAWDGGVPANGVYPARAGYFLFVTVNSSWGTYVPTDKRAFILKRDAGSWVQIGSEGLNDYDTGWHKLRLEVDASGNVKGYVDGNLEVSGTDTQYAAGFPGMVFYEATDVNAAGAFDNFLWTAETAEPTPTPPSGFAYEKTISATGNPLAIATGPDGSLYYGLFNSADSAVVHIADPVNADDTVTTITDAAFSVFPAGRGISGVAVDSSSNLYVTGDTGAAATAVIKKFGPAPSFTPDAGFSVAALDLDRFTGCDLFDDDYLAVCTFSSVRVYQTADGVRVGGGLFVAGQAYHRDVAVNTVNKDVFVGRNGDNKTGTVLYWSGGSPPLDLASYVSTPAFIDPICSLEAFAFSGQHLDYYAPQSWLLVNNRGSGTGEGNDGVGELDIYRISGQGATAAKTLVTTLDGTETGTAFGDAVDAAVYQYGDGIRIFVTDGTNDRIVVYTFSTPTEAVGSWMMME